MQILETDILFVKNELLKIAETNNCSVNESTLEKIAKAKLRFFGLQNYKKCPCYPQTDTEHGCGKTMCLNEIKTQGICHCNLFKKKEGKTNV